MKSFKYLLPLIFFSVLLTACEEDDDLPTSGDVINAVTGNSLEAEVDGQNISFTPYVQTTGDTILFGGFEGNTYPQITLLMSDTMSARTYTLSANLLSKPTIQYFYSDTSVHLTDNGSLTISEFNKSNKTIKGTFEVVLKPFLQPDSTVIRNGAFTCNY